MAITGQNLPFQQVQFTNPDGSLSYSGYQYLLSILNAEANAIPTATVATALTATGTNQATALQLSSQWNEIDTTPVGTGVVLSSYQPGQSQTVINADPANALKIYPPVDFQIDALGVDMPYSLASGSRISFDFISSTQIRS